MARALGAITIMAFAACIPTAARAQVLEHLVSALKCPPEAANAVNVLQQHVAGINAERQRLEAELKSLTGAFETIKALTLADVTKETGKITVLPAFPVVAPTPAMPQAPRLDQLRCFEITAGATAPVTAWRKRATDAAEAKEKVEKELANLKATYEAFKAITVDL